MGKSTRIRINRADTKISAPIKTKTKKKSYMPKWVATLLVSLCALLLVGVCLFGILSANGVFGRYNAALKTENFRVSSNMMTYYLKTQYENFQNNYSSYMSYFSLDTSKSLKDQTFGDTNTNPNAMDATFLGEYNGTWFDYFMDQTTAQTKAMLAWCEEAHERGIELTEEDLASVEESLISLDATASTYGYTLDTYITNLYGTGIKKSDLRRAMELETLATKCSLAVQDELLAAITDEDIEKEYAENPLDYNVIDYSYFTFDVTYEEVAKEVLGDDYTTDELNEKKDDVLKAYKDKIAELEAKANAMAKITGADEFKKAILTHIAEEYYDLQYGQKTFEESDLPSEEDIATIKTKTVAAVVDEIFKGEDETETDAKQDGETWTLYDIEVKEAYAKAFESIKKSVFASVMNEINTYIVDKELYQKDNEFSEWAFGDDAAANKTKTVFTGAGTDGEEITSADTSYQAYVYFLRTPQRPDKENTKNIAYMVFPTESMAVDALETLKETDLTLEEFQNIAEKKSATLNSRTEDYTKGTLGVDALDAWLYTNKAEVGSLSDVIKVDDSTYLIAYYYEVGDEEWYVAVKKSMFTEDYTVFEQNLGTKFEITVKDRALKKIDA